MKCPHCYKPIDEPVVMVKCDHAGRCNISKHCEHAEKHAHVMSCGENCFAHKDQKCLAVI